jgi:phosphohistidine phosphatase
MKRLLLVRHAKSSWRDPSLADIDRPLNQRGKRDAPVMGERLKAQGLLPDLIIASPAKRARKTAKILAEKLGYPKNKVVYEKGIYTEEVRGITARVQAVDAAVSSIMLVGHNPELTLLAEGLTARQVDNIPTCGVFCLEFSCQSWRDISAANSRLLFFDYPKNRRLPGS